jgi:serine/threonine protein kinase
MIYKTQQSSNSATRGFNARNPPSTEISILSSISHSNIISFMDSFEDSLCFYLTMEHFGLPWRHRDSSSETLVIPSCQKESVKYSLVSVSNGSSASLFDYIDEFGGVPSHLVHDIFGQIAQGLGYLHSQGIVHGDVKEENILIDYKNNRHIAKLCDFGHAKRTKRNRLDMKFYGTRDCSAPELLPNLRAVENDEEPELSFYGYKQDVWALGLVLYTMLHGSLPMNNDQLVGGSESLQGLLVYPTEFSPHIEKGNFYLLGIFSNRSNFI